MTARELLPEIYYPVANAAVLLTMVVFFLLTKLAVAAGLFGIWLAIVILPAMFRFLMEMVDARILDRKVEPPGIEMFNWIAGAWTLMPFALLVGMVWLLIEMAERFGPLASLALGAVLLCLYPASMAILALTRSAIGSINPVAVSRLIRICGPNYWLIPAVVAGLAVVFQLLGQAGLPKLALDFANVYLFFLLFSLTGAIVARSDAVKHVENPEPAEPGEDVVEALAEKGRVKILDHAYGLISRGNREGGFAHIQSHLDKSPSIADDYRWFFEAMLSWEETDPALFFAQRYLSYLLSLDDQVAALKLVSRCVLENPRFRPLPDDRDRMLELAQAYGRDDLSKLLS